VKELISFPNDGFGYRIPVDAIREILLEKWDPLNIGDNPHLSKDYDEFIPRIFKMLKDQPTEESVFDLLSSIECELGIPRPNPDQTKIAADALLHLRLNSAD
jgi:hypothetical protein